MNRSENLKILCASICSPVCVYVYVWTCVHVCMCVFLCASAGMSATAHWWKEETDLRLWSSPITLFETESLIIRNCIYAKGQVGRSTGLWELLCLCFLTHYRTTGITNEPQTFSVHSGDLYWSSHICMVSALSTEPFPQSDKRSLISEGSKL